MTLTVANHRSAAENVYSGTSCARQHFSCNIFQNKALRIPTISSYTSLMKHKQKSASPCELACPFDAPPHGGKHQSKNNHGTIVSSNSQSFGVLRPDYADCSSPFRLTNLSSQCRDDCPFHAGSLCRDVAPLLCKCLISPFFIPFHPLEFAIWWLSPKTRRTISHSFTQNCTRHTTSDHPFFQWISPKISPTLPQPSANKRPLVTDKSFM